MGNKSSDYLRPKGEQGDVGVPGPQGPSGNTIHTVTSAPASGLGVDGDYAINTALDQLYGPKSGTDWGVPTSLVGPSGTDGTDGRTVLSGSTNPSAGTGTDGDFYVNTTSSTIYGPKAGTWPTGINLIGPQGPPGNDGADGTGATEEATYLIPNVINFVHDITDNSGETIVVDVTSFGCSINLPTTPIMGSKVLVTAKGDATTNPVLVLPNTSTETHTIELDVVDEIDLDGGRVEYVFDGTSKWKITLSIVS